MNYFNLKFVNILKLYLIIEFTIQKAIFLINYFIFKAQIKLALIFHRKIIFYRRNLFDYQLLIHHMLFSIKKIIFLISI
jgi:hypothetical protein